MEAPVSERNREVHILVRAEDRDDPVVIMHNLKDDAIGPKNPAHCFGPFLGVDDAISFMEAMGDANKEDDCIKTIIPMFPPPATRVLFMDDPTPAPDDRRN